LPDIHGQKVANTEQRVRRVTRPNAVFFPAKMSITLSDRYLCMNNQLENSHNLNKLFYAFFLPAEVTLGSQIYHLQFLTTQIIHKTPMCIS
jgi:hypothetical protein